MPFIERYTPDYSRLAALYQRGGEQLAELALRRGANQAALFDRLGALFTGFHDFQQQKKAMAAATALRAQERAEDRGEKQKDRDERKAEREADAKIRKEEQDRGAARWQVDNTKPGVYSKVAADLALKFPETAARYSTQFTLPARPLPAAAGEMSLTPQETGNVVLHASPDDARADEQLAAQRAAAQAAAARAAVDDARQASALQETIRHNQVMERRPSVGSTPVVVQTPQGPAVLNRQTLTAEPITMGGETVGPVPTATERMDARKFSKAAPVLDSISELSERINTAQGVYAKMAGGAAKIAAKANLDDDVAEYESLISGFTPMVARALGHTGVLTQQDVDSVKALFPRPGDSKTLRDRKMKRMLTIIGQLEGTGDDASTGTTPPPTEEWVRDSTGKLVRKGGG